MNAFRRWIGSHMKVHRTAKFAARSSVDSGLFTPEYMASHSWPNRDVNNNPPHYVPRVLEVVHLETVYALLEKANRLHYLEEFQVTIAKKFYTATTSWNKLVRTTFQRH